MVESQKFEKIKNSENPLKMGEYDYCTFEDCDFSDANFRGFVFSECTFKNCNLSNANITNSSMKDVKFISSKCLGLNFGNCNPFLFEVNFKDCILNHSSFFKQNLKKAEFDNCSLESADFADCNLTLAVFRNCNLLGAIFDNSNLEKTDFRTAINFRINPSQNKIAKARFSSNNLSGLLLDFNISIE